jgi:hypothetical protein
MGTRVKSKIGEAAVSNSSSASPPHTEVFTELRTSSWFR